MWPRLLLLLASLHCGGAVSLGFRNFGNFSREDGRIITYFISNYVETPSAAAQLCSNMFNGGHLLTIYTQEEDEYIRLRLQAEGIGAGLEYVISDGRYNDVAKQWEWSTLSLPLVFTNWVNGISIPEAGGYCLELIGELSSYGWVSVACSNKHLFICQF